MLVDIRKSNIFTPANGEQPLYSRVRFIMRNGVAAVWLDDRPNPSQRLARLEGVVFTKRRLARDPHVLTLPDETIWHIFPLSGGGCGCNSSLKGVSYTMLLAPDS